MLLSFRFCYLIKYRKFEIVNSNVSLRNDVFLIGQASAVTFILSKGDYWTFFILK